MDSLGNELIQMPGGGIKTRLNLIFITSSYKNIDDYQPLKLPAEPTALDSWILREQSLVLTHNWKRKDELVMLMFGNFTNEMFVKFSQSVLV